MSAIEPHVWSNGAVVGLLLGALFTSRVVRRNRLWREAVREIWTRRRVAIVVVGV